MPSPRLLTDIALALAAASLAFWLARGDGASNTPAATAAEITAKPPVHAGRQWPPPRFTVVRKATRQTPYQRLRDESPDAANTIENALIEATARSVAERNADIFACGDEHQLFGPFAIEIETRATVAPSAMHAEPWRVINVRNGSPLSPDAIACIENVLSSPVRVDAQAATFPSYVGPLAIIYRVDFPTPELADHAE